MGNEPGQIAPSEEAYRVAEMAAFPGLPPGVDLDQARRRVRAAVDAAWRVWAASVAREEPPEGHGDGPHSAAEPRSGHPESSGQNPAPGTAGAQRATEVDGAGRARPTALTEGARAHPLNPGAA